MPPVAIRVSASEIDLTPRIQWTTTVGASPSAAAETIIGTLTLANFGDLAVQSGIVLSGWAAFTVGTSGANANLRVRQTNVSGTVVATTGNTTAGIAGAALATLDVEGVDAAPGVSVYVLTLQVGSAAAGSTVSALMLRAIVA